MKLVFFGTSEFAVGALEALTESSHQVAAVVTQPKRQRGRGLKLLPLPVEEAAQKHGLEVLRFEDVNSKEIIASLKEKKAQVFVVAAFGQIFSSEFLEVPTLYPINIHGSLLPKYRGAAPAQWAIINGEKKTGVTIMRISRHLDGGDIIAQREIDIGRDEDASTLNKRLSVLGARLLIQTLEKIEAGEVKFMPQDESKASFAPKLKKKDGLIDWRKDALSIKNLVRGCAPWPSAYTHLNGKLLKLLEVSISAPAGDYAPGEVANCSEEGILTACGKGALLIKRLQLEGKRPLTAAEFLRGHPCPKLLG